MKSLKANEEYFSVIIIGKVDTVKSWSNEQFDFGSNIFVIMRFVVMAKQIIFTISTVQKIRMGRN